MGQEGRNEAQISNQRPRLETDNSVFQRVEAGLNISLTFTSAKQVSETEQNPANTMAVLGA